MTTSATWTPFEAPIGEILSQYPEPLLALAHNEVPAFVLRQHYDPAHCQALMQRFYQRGLLYDPHQTGAGASRVDICTSFGRHRADREAFHAHSAETLALFETLFDGYDDPVHSMYGALQELAPSKQVKTAREPDGRLYGPAIFRIYHRETGHGPHYDSVAKRSRAFEYQISRFKHQFAGILCFQTSSKEAGTGEPYLYNCPFQPEITEHLTREKFPAYVADQSIERVQVQLEPGDLYFFCTENVHEVPSIVGEQPRAVLAIFFAMSPDDDEIYVWA